MKDLIMYLCCLRRGRLQCLFLSSKSFTPAQLRQILFSPTLFNSLRLYLHPLQQVSSSTPCVGHHHYRCCAGVRGWFQVHFLLWPNPVPHVEFPTFSPAINFCSTHLTAQHQRSSKCSCCSRGAASLGRCEHRTSSAVQPVHWCATAITPSHE
jgi:hypothetical protein